MNAPTLLQANYDFIKKADPLTAIILFVIIGAVLAVFIIMAVVRNRGSLRSSAKQRYGNYLFRQMAYKGKFRLL